MSIRVRPSILAFNRGLISSSGLARVDIDRVRLSAEVQTNWMPRVLGSMSLRPGMKYLGSTKDDNFSKTIPFIFSAVSQADVEFTDSVMRVWVDDAIVSRGAVTASVTNGSFLTDLTGWADADEAGATSAWNTGNYLSLVGSGTLPAVRTQVITVIETGEEHGIRIKINRGRVIVKIGSSAGENDYLSTVLAVGEHSIAITPTTDMYIRLENSTSWSALVESFEIEAAGNVELPIPYRVTDLPNIRYEQSGDIIFIACSDFQQRMVERRAERSWSFVTYETTDGPFGLLNTSGITFAPSAITGDITMTASQDGFSSDHVGSLIKITHSGQSATANIAAEATWTDDIEVTGVSGARIFTVNITGTWSGTVTLQRSVGVVGDWSDVETYTVNTAKSFDDELENQIVFYRLGIDTGDYTSGTAVCTLTYSSGSQIGIARITAYQSATVVNCAVLTAFGNVGASTDWQLGVWSEVNGWPSAVVLHEGRLWWFGKDKIIGSVSDAYLSFDEETVGDSGPLNRSIGYGPVDTIRWAISLNRILLGTDNNSSTVDAVKADANTFLSIRSSSLDEPLTSNNFNIRSASATAFYVDRSGQRISEMVYDQTGIDYAASEITLTVPDLFEGGISHIALQEKPERRLHCIKSDGTVGVFVHDPAENVQCWINIETDGIVEDITVRPGAGEDQVYYTVKRIIDGVTKRYREKFALESECRGGVLNKQLDSFVLFSGASTTTITGLDHLEAETVHVWGDGAYNGSYLVASGSITLDTAVEEAVIGLTYTAQYKSSKLAYGSKNAGTALLLKKRVTELGVILKDTHHQGLQYGPDFNNLDDLPSMEQGVTVADDTIHSQYDEQSFEFNGEWDTDSRLCLQAQAPKPCTVLAGVIAVETSER